MKVSSTLLLPARPRVSAMVIPFVIGLLALAMGGVWSTCVGWVVAPPLTARLAGTTSPRVVFALADGNVVKVDAVSGAVLARQPHLPSTMLPSLAVSSDGRSVFVLEIQWQGASPNGRLSVLSADTLWPQVTVPADSYAQDGVALAVTSDDRTVVIYHEHPFPGTSPDYWLSYFDRQSGHLLAAQTGLPGCGSGGQLIPMASQLAVLCRGTDDVRIVDLGSQEVVRTISLLPVPKSNRAGGALAAGTIPGSSALAVLLDDGQLLRLDPTRQSVSQVADLAPERGRVVPIGGAVFSQTGRAVIALSNSAADWSVGRASTLLVVDLVTGQVMSRLAQVSQYGISITPDGQRAFLRTQPLGELFALDLGTHRALPFGPAHANELAFS